MNNGVQNPEKTAALKKELMKKVIVTAIVSVIITCGLGALFFTNALVQIVYGKVKPELIPTAPGWSDVMMVIILSLLSSGFIAYTMLRKTFKAYNLYLDSGLWQNLKSAPSRFESDYDLPAEPAPAPIVQSVMVPNPVNESLKEENRKLREQYDTLAASVGTEQKLNELLLTLISAEDTDRESKKQEFLHTFSSYLKADFSGIYVQDKLSGNYIKHLTWDSEPQFARHSDKVNALNPEIYPWTFKTLKSGKAFSFKSSMLDSLMKQIESAEADAKAWLQMKVDETAEYLLCKHEGWKFMIAMPCATGSDLNAVMLFGYQQSEDMLDSTIIQRMLPVSSVLTKTIIRKGGAVSAPVNDELYAGIQNLEYGVVITDTNGMIKLANPAALGFAINPAEGLNQKHLETAFGFCLPENHQPAKNVFTKVIADAGDHTASVYLIKKPDGITRTVELITTPVTSPEGVTDGYLIMMQDITTRLEAETDNLKAQKFEAVSYLSSGLAHDFNNILTAILGNISLALDDIPQGSDAAKLLHAAEESTLKGKGITDQLLTLAKSSTPEHTASETKTNLMQTIDTLLKGSGVRVTYHIDDNLPYIDMAQDAFNSVISNLVMNAMQAMPTDGELIVRAQYLPMLKEHDLPLQSGKYVCIHLVDNGEGIRQENQTRIFVPYFTTRKGKTGMGLTNVYSILKKYNGHIRIHSQDGRGTDCEIYIPATDTPVRSIDIPAAVPTQTNIIDLREEPIVHHKPGVIILKDEDMLRNLLVKTLEKMELDVQTTADPDEMLLLYSNARDKKIPINMVIIDFNVPGVADFQPYIDKLRQYDPHLKLVASRSYIEANELIDFKEMGFDDILSKPFHIADLKGMVSRNISSAQ